MQNRIYLYLLRPDGEPGEFQWIASANGFLPSLWQVLLADGAQAPQLRDVLGGESTLWIAADATVALAHYVRFIDFLKRHPQIDRVDGLSRYLEGARQFLAESIAQSHAPGRTAPVLCANLDHPTRLLMFREFLERIMRSEDFNAIEELLCFPSRNLRFTDWKAWSGMFGLAQFEPEYFSAAFRQPFAGDYLDYDYDEFGSAADLGNGCYRCKSGAYWGVRRVDADQEFTILQPEWDRVLRTGAGDQSLLWVKRNGRFGLAAIAGSQAGYLLRQPDLDEVNGFIDGIAIVRSGKAMGLLATDGSWHLRPCMDEIYAYAQQRAVVRVQGKFGFIDAGANVVVTPDFDEADDFTAAGVARVRLGNQCGLIRSDGGLALPLQFSQVEWSDQFAGWMCRRDGSPLLARADGSIWIDSGFDAIEMFVRGRLIRVKRAAQYGLLRWTGETLLPCEFDELCTREQTAVMARRNGRVGLISEVGEQLIPFEFSYIDALEPHFENGACLIKPELLRVLSAPGKAAPRVGVWDIAQRRCVVPCVYDFVWMTLFGAADRYGFIVANRNPKRGSSAKGRYRTQGRYRVGLLRSDGSVLVPQDYAWIGECTPLNRDDAMNDLRSTLYYYWSRGKPVRAAIDEHGPLVELPPSPPADYHA